MTFGIVTAKLSIFNHLFFTKMMTLIALRENNFSLEQNLIGTNLNCYF